MRSILFATTLSFVLFGGLAQAADIEAGKTKSAVCAACHGGTGISPTPIWPNLAGQKEQYLVAQMKAFRDGGRQNAQMSPMATNLTDEDIANLAAYYASLGCK